MSTYDWLMATGAVTIIAFLVKAFWRADRIDAIEQPDNWPPTTGDGPPGN